MTEYYGPITTKHVQMERNTGYWHCSEWNKSEHIDHLPRTNQHHNQSKVHSYSHDNQLSTANKFDEAANVNDNDSTYQHRIWLYAASSQP